MKTETWMVTSVTNASIGDEFKLINTKYGYRLLRVSYNRETGVDVWTVYASDVNGNVGQTLKTATAKSAQDNTPARMDSWRWAVMVKGS